MLNVGKKKKPHVFVVGNEKGGVGKTTCCMHLISHFLNNELKVVSIDVDSRQASLTSYVENRKKYNELNQSLQILVSDHFLIDENFLNRLDQDQIKDHLEKLIYERDADVVIIDTPGNNTYISRLSHSYADTIITPINDSFVDMDVLCKVDSKTMTILSPSIYSEMIWKQKIEKAARGGSSIDWIVMRNRTSSTEAINKKNISIVLADLSKRLGLKIAPGFSERVIFRELFLQGLTLLDIGRSKKSFTPSNITARQEFRDFVSHISHDIKKK